LLWASCAPVRGVSPPAAPFVIPRWDTEIAACRIPEGAQAFEVWGVDVSHHQHRIDWRKLTADKRIGFAYVKATEGVSFVDGRFRENWSAARRAGLRVGAYHFFRLCSP